MATIPIIHRPSEYDNAQKPESWDDWRGEKQRRERALPYCPVCFQDIYPGEKYHALVNEFGAIECLPI